MENKNEILNKEKKNSNSTTNNKTIKKKEQITTTSCKQINSTTFQWSITLPSHPIPPFNLKLHPLAIIIGWIGAGHKTVEKYNKIYRDNGFATLSFVPPVIGHFFPKKMKIIAYNFSEYLLDHIKNTPRSITIQVFSGNLVFLSFVYELWLQQKDKYKILIDAVKGQVFDSCPSEISADKAYTSLVAPYPKSKLYKRAVATTCKIYSTIIDVPKLNQLFWERLSNCPIKSQQIYFYSVDDEITSYLDVEKGADIMRKQGIKVIQIKFDQSKHCNHLGFKYMKGLYRFWDTSLKLKDPISFRGTSSPATSNYQNILSNFVSKL